MILSMLSAEQVAPLLFGLVRATIALSIAVCFVVVVLRVTRVSAPLVHRCVWTMTLMCGFAMFPLTIYTYAKSIDKPAGNTIARRTVASQLPLAEPENLAATVQTITPTAE